MTPRTGAGLQARTAAPRFGLLVLAVVLIVLVVYLPVLGAPFLWDDHLLVSSSEHDAGLLRFFSASFWAERDWGAADGAYYRPLTLLSLSLDARLHGDNAAGFHLTNLLLHVVNVVVLCCLLREVAIGAGSQTQRSESVAGRAGLCACAGGLVLGLSPRLSESVAWVSGRTDLLASMFCLLALLVWSRRPSKRILAAALVLLGLFSKEVAVAALAALLVRALLEEETLRARLLAAAPLLAVAALYATLRGAALAGTSHVATQLPWPDRGIVIFEALGRYAWITVNPWQPRALQGDPERVQIAWAIAGAVFAALLVWRLATLSWRRVRLAKRPTTLALQGAMFAAVGLGLVVWIWPLPLAVVVADRFLYLPMAGLLLWAAVEAVPQLPAGDWRWMAALVGVAALGYRCFDRVLDFSDEGRFWSLATQQSPGRWVPWSELGSVYFRAGHLARASACYERAVALRETPITLSNVSLARASLGDYQGALPPLLVARDRLPGAAKLELDLALLRLKRLEPDLAANHLSRCLTLQPAHVGCRTLSAELDFFRATAPHLQLPLGERSSQSMAERARLEARFGRTTESVSLWAPLLRDPQAGAVLRREAMEALILFAPPPLAVEHAVSFREHGGDEATLSVLAVRAQFYDRLSALAPP